MKTIRINPVLEARFQENLKSQAEMREKTNALLYKLEALQRTSLQGRLRSLGNDLRCTIAKRLPVFAKDLSRFQCDQTFGLKP